MNIEPERFRSQIVGVFREFGIPDCELHIVPSVQAWAEARGVPEPSPTRVAMAVTWTDGRRSIALKQCITPKDRRDVVDGMLVRRLDDETDRIEDPLSFLEHLVLHEIAELLYPTESETEKDRRAFQLLAKRFHRTP